MALQEKLEKLSPKLREKIIVGEREYTPDPKTPITNWLVHTKRHCNGGKTVDAGLWLKRHCDDGGKIFLTMSGAGSSFQLGVPIGDLIRAGKIAHISVSGANLEESLYRLISNGDYAYIPKYVELTPEEEKELDEAGLRRITDTFLPEDETTRKVLPVFEALWREAQQKGESHLWHEYFFKFFETDEFKEMLKSETAGNLDDCWLHQAWKNNIPVTVHGPEDSTMGNIFTYYTYYGTHPFLSEYKQKEPISSSVVLPNFVYMHRLAEWYMDETKEKGLAFLQLGGGGAGDFVICVAPHLKKDYLADETPEVQDKLVRPWAAFIEIHSSPMSFGSYSGAGFKEKITWSKLAVDAYGMQIYGDYTEHFPDIAAIILGY